MASRPPTEVTILETLLTLCIMIVVIILAIKFFRGGRKDKDGLSRIDEQKEQEAQ